MECDFQCPACDGDLSDYTLLCNMVGLSDPILNHFKRCCRDKAASLKNVALVTEAVTAAASRLSRHPRLEVMGSQERSSTCTAIVMTVADTSGFRGRHRSPVESHVKCLGPPKVCEPERRGKHASPVFGFRYLSHQLGRQVDPAVGVLCAFG